MFYHRFRPGLLPEVPLLPGDGFCRYGEPEKDSLAVLSWVDSSFSFSDGEQFSGGFRRNYLRTACHRNFSLLCLTVICYRYPYSLLVYPRKASIQVLTVRYCCEGREISQQKSQ